MEQMRSKQALTREEKAFDDKIRGLERNYCIVKMVTNRTQYTLYNTFNTVSVLEVYDDFEEFKQEVMDYLKI